MRPLLLGALPCVLAAQAPPLSFDDILSRARSGPAQYRAEALLAERHRALAGTGGFLREGPALALSAGPRAQPSAPTFTDRAVEVDLPLFLSPGVRRRLEAALGEADPLLRSAGGIEARFQLRRAYLDAWLAERLLHLRERDLATVETWLQAARARLEAGADPAFQAALVEGELLRAQGDLDEARQQRAAAWAALRHLAEVPAAPAPLTEPGDPPGGFPDGLRARYEAGTLRRALLAQADLEQQALRHQEALAASRWSLRGSYAREGEERVGRVGLAYRFARPGEAAALRRETEAALQAGRREGELALEELDARFQAAMARLPAAPPRAFAAFDPALQAVELRLREGRERPSEALPIRRQLLDVQAAAYRRLRTAHLLSAELQALTEGVTP
ncbi:TolC family protein [Geothrix sp. 21YS21S-4]|uniref:TolC family protein n=1 Tax=Geothrix sp. 21YS21S-4 TaxID=3068889 RepID=UPI0027B8EA65|nr:TolC family protein [Geothrix sp. 21YS21S-4]